MFPDAPGRVDPYTAAIESRHGRLQPASSVCRRRRNYCFLNLSTDCPGAARARGTGRRRLHRGSLIEPCGALHEAGRELSGFLPGSRGLDRNHCRGSLRHEHPLQFSPDVIAGCNFLSSDICFAERNATGDFSRREVRRNAHIFAAIRIYKTRFLVSPS